MHQKRIWGRIANEILMLLRASKKYTKEVSLYEPIGVDKDGEAVSLVDVIEVEDKAFEDSREDILKSIRLSKRYLDNFIL